MDEEATHERSCASGWCEGGRALEQSGEMKAQSVVAKNGGHRGGRHEGAVTVPTKRRGARGGGRRRRPPRAVGCMRRGGAYAGAKSTMTFFNLCSFVFLFLCSFVIFVPLSTVLCSIFVRFGTKLLVAKQTRAGKVYHQELERGRWGGGLGTVGVGIEQHSTTHNTHPHNTAQHHRHHGASR